MKLVLTLSLLLTAFAAGAQTDSAQTASRKNRELNEVSVSAGKRRLKEAVSSTQMGKVDLPVSLLLKAPAIAGEQDVIKALQLTPGVKRGTEGGIGMYVRGGGQDENLILMDGATVYNAGHLLGFFSVFNAAAVKDVQLYKSSFPAQYGGRLSSVLDVKTKEGSMTDYKATASIGLISSSASVSGPILKDKLSVSVAARRTYIDKVFRYIPYHFYDVNAKLSYVVNKHNRIYLSAYKGNDVLKMTTTDSSDGATVRSGMNLGNTIGSLRWNSTHKAYSSDLTLFATRFGYDVSGSMGPNSLTMRSSIEDIGLRQDVRFCKTGAHKLSAGLTAVRHFFNPNMVQSEGGELEKFPSRASQEIYNHEAAVYLNDEYRVNDRCQLAGGLRLSSSFVNGIAYVNAEPRLAARYLIDESNSIKVSYARMAQYMHLVSSSSLTLPTDLWYPVTAKTKPGISDQVSAGYYRALPLLGISVSVEGYYKWLRNLVEYREGAILILNDNYENELVHGKGRSYGTELFISKTTGKFTGWMGYSLSYAKRQFDSLNNGKEYFARYDRRHDFSLVGMYDLGKRWGASGTAVYSTGSPFTGQTGQYIVPNRDFTGFEPLPSYTDRNALRMSAAFRIDLDLAYKFALSKRIKGEAHISMYNVLNRTQPNRVEREWDEETKTFSYQQKGLFGNITTAAINFNL